MLLLALLACEPEPELIGGGATIELETTLGRFVLELDGDAAPRTRDNFVRYVEDGFYDGADGDGATVFHRVKRGFVVQGGGLRSDLSKKDTRDSVPNESVGGLKNLRGTVAMARTSNPDSATAQFFVNLEDNDNLDATPDTPGYTVFGRVTEGMDVIDAIAALPTGTVGQLDDVPDTEVRIEAARRTDGGP